MSHNTRPNPVRRLKIPTWSPPRLGKEAFRGFLAFFASTCFVCRSRYLQIFVNKVCVHCVACASLHFVLLWDVALSAPAFAIDISNASQGSASSSGPQDPKGPQDGGSLEFEADMIDDDVVNLELPEPGDTQSRLQHAFAALCLQHKPSETIEPRKLRVFLDRLTPKQYAISPKDTLLAMLMHKNLEIPVLTTRESVGPTTPSKHETSYGIQYRKLCIVGPDPVFVKV